MAAQMRASVYVQIPNTRLLPEQEGVKEIVVRVAAEVSGDVIYNWDQSKKALVAQLIITEDFAGLLQCDGGSETECYRKDHC